MWDQRYGTREYVYGTAPNDFLAQHARDIPERGRVLCLADGEGRNGVHLATLGHPVVSVDLSEVGLAKARKLAETRGVRIETVHADLAEYDFAEARWDGIVSISAHLPGAVRRSVHAAVVRALRPAGVLILEAYTPDQIGRGTGGPSDPDFMMTEQILRAELPGLAFEHLATLERSVVEGSFHTGVASVVQCVARRPASLQIP